MPRAFLTFVAASALACGGASPKPDVSASPKPTAEPGGKTTPPNEPKPGPTAAPAKGDGPGLTQLSVSEPDCALDAEGRAYRWPKGKLELDPANVKGAKAISCSRSHTCVVAEDASALCWGDNTYGALGDGTEKNSDKPVKVTGLASVAEIHADFSRTCARTTNGDVLCWGDREFGKAGDGTMIDNKGREKTTAGKSILGGATSLGISMIHACATLSDGGVSCWGQCRSGACGQPPKPPWIIRPMKTTKVTGLGSLVAGENATCGLDKTGGVLCWGLANGLLGPSVTDNKAHDAPVKIDLPGPAAEVAIGVGGHACARLASGAVHCWGKNEKGQLGDGTTKDRAAAATPVKGIADATRIACGTETSCALAQSGRLFCWGEKYGPSPVEITREK